MKLSNLIDQNLIIPKLECTSKEDLITKAIPILVKKDSKLLPFQSKIIESVINRENLASTVIESGFLIPHARIDGFTDFIICPVIPALPFASADAAGVMRIVRAAFIILAPTDKSKLLLQTLAAISKLSVSRNLDNILNSSSAQDIYSEIQNSGIMIKSSLDAEDMMRTNISPAYLGDTIGSVAKRMVAENINGFPVLNNAGQFVGDITEEDLISFGIPNYATYIGDLSFLTNDEPFRAYFEKADTTAIDALVNLVQPVTVDANTSLMEICYLMTTKNLTRVYVLNNKKLLGVIYRTDIIRKVLSI